MRNASVNLSALSRGGTEAGRFPEIELPAASSQMNLAAVAQLLGIDPDIGDRCPISLQNNVSGFILLWLTSRI